MAYIKIHNIKATVRKAITYITDPEKTDKGLLVSAYNCDIDNAHFDFQMTKMLAEEMKGKESTSNGENLAHHIIQSFAPWDKITPEEAHKIGKQFADEFLKGKYEYVIATHTDKGQLHNHIIFNATSFYDFKKFRNYKVNSKMRAINNRISIENNLYVGKFRNQKFRSYYEWEMRNNKKSWVSQLEEILQDTIDHAETFEGFCDLLRNQGIDIGNADPAQGKHIKFRMSGQQRFCRGYNLQGQDGQDFSRESILKRISEREQKRGASYADQIEHISYKTRLHKSQALVDALNVIRSSEINKESDFEIRASSLDQQLSDMRDQIKEVDNKNAEYKKVVGYLITYNKYLPIKEEAERRKIGKKTYIASHKSELEAFDYALKEIERRGLSTTIDVDKVLELIRNQDSMVEDLHKRGKEIEQMAQQIRKAAQLVKDLQRETGGGGRPKNR